MNFKNIFALFFWGVPAAASFAQTDMYVKEKMNTETAIPLAQIQSMNFGSGNLFINKIDGATSIYALSTLRYLSFTQFQDTEITTNIDHVTTFASLTIFPNPVQNILFVQSNGFKNVEILNVIGETVLQKIALDDAGIDVSSLSPGMYLCRICKGDTQIIKRFIKE